MPFSGLRVLSLESRRGPEMATLIRKQGGDPFVASSMRETPLEDEPGLVAFAEPFLRGDFDGFVFLTGVGTRMLWKSLLARYPEADLKQALNSLTKIVRGPKPSAALRELGVTPDVQVPEPNTWRELLETMRPRPEKRLAMQEYGESDQELIAGLSAQGREVTPVRVYRWECRRISPRSARPPQDSLPGLSTCSVHHFHAGCESDAHRRLRQEH